MREDLTREETDAILEEIAGMSVELEEDPTLPHLGVRYLSRALAQCRNFLNRVQGYVQRVGRFERDLKIRIKLAEADLDFKMKMKLADDPIVRNQSSIEDRKALATSHLAEEYKALADMQVVMLDIQETSRLLKIKYDDLNRTNSDIKNQRSLVKDDRMLQEDGQEGFSKTVAGQDRTIPDGIPPVVGAPKIDPRDLLDPSKRPADLPIPVDEVHAQQMAQFFSREAARPATPPILPKAPEEVRPTAGLSYDDLISG